MDMLKDMLDLKNTFEGKFLAVLMSVVLVMSMTNILAFAGNEGGEGEEPAVETPPVEEVATDSDKQAVGEAVQHGEEAAAEDASVSPEAPSEPLVSTTVDEAVVTFETEYAFVSVKDQVLSGTALATELHKELRFSASADTGFELASIKAKNAANADVPVSTQDGISTIAAEFVDSTLVVTVAAEPVAADEPEVETTPITSDTKIEAGESLESERFSVTLKVQGEEDEIVKVDAGTDLVLKAPAQVPDGATFVAWVDGDGESYGVGEKLTVSGDMVLTAQLEESRDGNGISAYSMMAAPQQELNAVIHYLDGSSEDSDGVIMTGDVQAPSIEGYDFVNATVGKKGDVVTYTAIMDGAVYYGTEESLSAGIAKPLPEGERIYLNYEKTPVKHVVTINVAGPESVYDDGNEVVPGAGAVEAVEGDPFNFQVKVMVGYTATVSYVGRDGKMTQQKVTVGRNQELVEKVFTTGAVTKDEVVTVSYEKTEKLTFEFGNTSSENWHTGAISYYAPSDSNLTVGGNGLFKSKSTFQSGDTVSFEIQTSKTNGTVDKWGYWQLNGLAINGQGLNIPVNRVASDKGNSAVTMLNNGSRVTITVVDTKIDKYAYKNHDCILFTYRVSIENAREDLTIGSGNFHNVFWPEILVRKADGVKDVKIAGTPVIIGVPQTQKKARNITFSVLPGYENPVALIDDEEAALVSTGGNSYRFTVPFKGSPDAQHAIDNQNFGERKVEITATLAKYAVGYYDGDAPLDQCVTNGRYDVVTNTQFVVTPISPVKAGYKFTGWKLGGKTYQPGDVVTLSEVLDSASGGNELRFEAQWETTDEKSYFVEVSCFDEHGNVLRGPFQYAFSSTSPVMILGTFIPEIDGYKFNDSHANNQSVATPSESGKGDASQIRLYYSKMHDVSYTWIGLPEGDLFDESGAKVDAPELPTTLTGIVAGDEYEIDSTLTGTVLYTHDRYGNVNTSYTLGAWNLTGTQVMGTANVTVSAVWERQDIKVASYPVTYIYEGNVPAGAPQLPAVAEYVPNQPVSVAPAPTVEGYTFSGWSRGDFEMPAESVEIVGTWKADFSGLDAEGIDKSYDGLESVVNVTGALEGDDVAFFVGDKEVGNSFVNVDDSATVTVRVTRGTETWSKDVKVEIRRDGRRRKGVRRHAAYKRGHRHPRRACRRGSAGAYDGDGDRRRFRREYVRA